MKMSDVFGGHDVWVSGIVATIEHDNVHSPMDESYVLESCSEYVLNSKIEMEAAAHAINNHDALVGALEAALEIADDHPGMPNLSGLHKTLEEAKS